MNLIFFSIGIGAGMPPFMADWYPLLAPLPTPVKPPLSSLLTLGNGVLGSSLQKMQPVARRRGPFHSNVAGQSPQSTTHPSNTGPGP